MAGFLADRKCRGGSQGSPSDSGQERPQLCSHLLLEKQSHWHCSIQEAALPAGPSPVLHGDACGLKQMDGRERATRGTGVRGEAVPDGTRRCRWLSGGEGRGPRSLGWMKYSRKVLTSELRPAWHGCCRRPVGIQTIGGWLVEPGRQGRWEGLGWHIALETEMNREVNRGSRGWEEGGWAPRASEAPLRAVRGAKGRRQAGQLSLGTCSS